MSDRRSETLALQRRMRAVWLSEPDRVQLIEKSLLTDEPRVLDYGISNNRRRFWDIEHARQVLGYEPQDAAPMLIGDEDRGGSNQVLRLYPASEGAQPLLLQIMVARSLIKGSVLTGKRTLNAQG